MIAYKTFILLKRVFSSTSNHKQSKDSNLVQDNTQVGLGRDDNINCVILPDLLVKRNCALSVNCDYSVESNSSSVVKQSDNDITTVWTEAVI